MITQNEPHVQKAQRTPSCLITQNQHRGISHLNCRKFKKKKKLKRNQKIKNISSKAIRIKIVLNFSSEIIQGKTE